MSSEEEGIVYRKNSEGDSEDIWDDSLLIEAYDRAVGAIQGVIKSKDNASDCEFAKKGKESKRKASKKKNRLKKEWKVGDACRAVFSEDGYEYEAYIIDINFETKICTVRFIGYLNEEQVNINELLQSQPHSREMQKQTCNGEFIRRTSNHQNDDMDWKECSNSPSCSSKRLNQKKRNKGHQKRSHSQFQPILTHQHHHHSHGMPSPAYSPSDSPRMPIIPPPPPIPEIEDLDEADESLTSMLISWYMSGYHTGYYQGLKHSSANRRRYDQGQTTPPPTHHKNYCCNY